MFVIVFVFVTVSAVVVSASLSAIAETPDGCLSYAYAADYGSSHYSLLKNGSLLVGSQVVAVSDCGGPFELYADGQSYGGADEVVVADVPLSTTTVQLIGPNWSQTFTNLSFMAGSDFAAAIAITQEEPPEGALWLTPAELSSRDVGTAIGAGLVLWVVVVSILSRLVSAWFERFYCEEVVA